MTLTLSPSPTRARVSTMRAATLIAPGTFEIQHVLVPKPGPDEMLVRIEGCGVCASNIPPFEGRDWFKYPMTPGQLGHEAWGVVEEAGEAINQFRVGDRVAILTNHAYAEYDLARERQTVRLPAALDGKPFPAEPLGCAINIFRRSRITKGQTVAIVGIGFLGALLTRLASDIGANVIAISRRPFSLDMARDMGARELLEMDDHWKIIERVKEITFGRFCDVVVEAVGKQWPLDLAGELTGERGRLVVAGYHQDGLRQVNMQLWNWRGFDVINAHERDPNIYLAGMQAAVELVSSGRLDPRSLYTHRFSLENLGKAMEMTAQRPDGFFKALVTM